MLLIALQSFLVEQPCCTALTKEILVSVVQTLAESLCRELGYVFLDHGLSITYIIRSVNRKGKQAG